MRDENPLFLSNKETVEETPQNTPECNANFKLTLAFSNPHLGPRAPVSADAWVRKGTRLL